MKLKDFITQNFREILVSSLFVVLCIVLLIVLAVFLKKSKSTSKSIVVGILFTLLLIGGLNYFLIKNIDKESAIQFSDSLKIVISPIVRLVLANIALIALYSFVVFNIYKTKEVKKITTSNITFLGILVAVASVVMLFSMPIMPAAPFLKLELSGLIIFMVFLWYGMKEAMIVSLLTNFIHALIGPSTPIIPFLDEAVNFIATMTFILPTYIYLKNRDLHDCKSSTIAVFTVIGVLFTTVFMTLYNAFFNIPIVYSIPMSFGQVVSIFGVFNLLKWGAVAIAINLLWKRLYVLAELRAES